MSKLVIDATGNNLTYRIIGAGMAVHNFIGPGYKEIVYERALAVELGDRGIAVERQFPVEVRYADERVGQFYLDLFVERTVVVEVKAFPHLLTRDEEGQIINYLKATQASVGLLINFGRPSLDWQRIFPPKNIDPVQRIGRYDGHKAARRRGDPPEYVPASKRNNELRNE